VLRIVAVVLTMFPMDMNRHSIVRRVLDRLSISPKVEEHILRTAERSVTEEEKSKAELERLQKLIEDRKQIARDSDLAYHLWGLYRSLFRGDDSRSPDHTVQFGTWYDVRTLRVTTRDGLNELEFELQGGRYRFVDDEEKQGWRENLKYFSLFLYDDADRCLIEIPMKMRVDSLGRDYSIMMDGPRAFLPGSWTSDFINVRLKHESIRNQEIRSQKHQERLREIEDLRKRFGIAD